LLIGRSPDAERDPAGRDALLRDGECRGAAGTFRRAAMPASRVGERSAARCSHGRLEAVAADDDARRDVASAAHLRADDCLRARVTEATVALVMVEPGCRSNGLCRSPVPRASSAKT
jgi:hypothetical protein